MNYGLTLPASLPAQLNLGPPGDTPAVAPLPGPPLLEHYLFESPWIPAAALVVAAVIGAWYFNRASQARRGLIVSAVLLALAAAVVVTARAVTTTRETLIARTGELVAATARADTAALRDMLGRDVVLRAYFFNEPMPRDTLLDRVERYMGREYPVQSQRIDSAAAVIDGRNAARTQVHVVVRSPSATMYDFPVGSWWRIEWRLDPDGKWRANGLECLQLDVVRAGEKVGG